eukprot:8269683-Ditylum_brightwellii.AAC.1
MLELPSTIKEIKKSAFCECTELTSINIPGKVEVVNIKVFACCKNLMDVELPSTLKTNKGYVFLRAFEGCSTQTEEYVPPLEKALERRHSMDAIH